MERRKNGKELRNICEQGKMIPSYISPGRRKRDQHDWPEKQVELENCERPFIVTEILHRYMEGMFEVQKEKCLASDSLTNGQ